MERDYLEDIDLDGKSILISHLKQRWWDDVEWINLAQVRNKRELF